MTNLQISAVVLACVFGGALAGMRLARVLPPHHVSEETKDALRVASGTISVLSALVIGLLISYAKGNLDAHTKAVEKFAADLSLLDRVMRQYGPETDNARDLLRRYTAQKIAMTWPDGGAGDRASLDDPTTLEKLEGVQAKLLGLAPQNETQRWLQARALQTSGDLAETRWLLAAGDNGSIPVPFLVTLVFWLAILFIGFGLFAPRHGTVVVALLVCAISLSAAIFLTLEMDRPFGGFIRVPSEPMRNALAHMGS